LLKSYVIMETLVLHSTRNLDFLSSSILDVILPLISDIHAGVPTPATGFTIKNINPDKKIMRNLITSFFSKVKGNNLKDAGLEDGDLIVIDKSLDCKDGQIAICFLDGEFTAKRIRIEKGVCWLVTENPQDKPIKVTLENDFVIWGIVTCAIQSL
jgi:DNA polymerase V